jgi:hypothetical protein
VAKDDTVLDMLGEYLRELSVLVLVFFPLELSRGTELSRPLMVKVAEFSFASFAVGVIFSKLGLLIKFFKRAISALRREFGGRHE